MNLRGRDTHRAARQHFDRLSRKEQRQAICNMADFGIPEFTIAASTGLSIEHVRRILGERAGA